MHRDWEQCSRSLTIINQLKLNVTSSALQILQPHDKQEQSWNNQSNARLQKTQPSEISKELLKKQECITDAAFMSTVKIQINTCENHLVVKTVPPEWRAPACQLIFPPAAQQNNEAIEIWILHLVASQ